MSEESQEPATILSLTVDSYKRIHAARIEPSATGLVPVRGKNGVGKSSLIGSILDALGAEKAELPITEGAHGASVVLDLGPIVVKKVWTRDSSGNAKPSVKIEAADGGRLPGGPAAILKEWRGHLADPVAFMEMKPAEQVKTVLGVLGLDGELQRLEGLAVTHYDNRRDLARDADRLAKTKAELAFEMEGLPDESPDGNLDDLTQELQAAKDNNAKRESVRAKMDAVRTRGSEATKRLELLRTELAKLEDQVDEQREEWQSLAAEFDGMTIVAVEPIVQKISAHVVASEHAGRRSLFRSICADAEAANAAVAEAKEGLELARQQLADLLGSVEFPIDGMNYDPVAKLLTIGGIPFSQASQAERLKAAAAVAMAGNPRIKVIIVREGSLLDDESQLQLAEIAKASGFQLWLELVASSPEGSGIWIEDGEAFLDTDE